ncbi:hypothetical protein D3C73_1227120 [compost metagenome]
MHKRASTSIPHVLDALGREIRINKEVIEMARKRAVARFGDAQFPSDKVRKHVHS